MKIKLQSIAIVLLMIVNFSYAQKLEKIKGSKIVTLSEVELDSITSIELYKDIHLVLKKGEDKLVISADDNLHEILDVDVKNGLLSLSLLKKISSKKAFELTLYVSNLSEIILDDNSSLFNSNFYTFENMTVTLNNKAKLNCFLEGDIITFHANDNAKSESTFKAKSINYTLQDRVKVTNNSTSDITKITVEGRSDIILSGKSDTTIIHASQTTNSKLTNLLSNNTELIAEDKSTVNTNTKDNLTLSMKDNCKIYVYGKPDIDLVEFKGEATLYKKDQ